MTQSIFAKLVLAKHLLLRKVSRRILLTQLRLTAKRSIFLKQLIRAAGILNR